MEKLMLSMLVWLGTFMDLPVPDRLPAVAFLPACDIQTIYRPEETCNPDFGAAAIYDHRPDGGVVYLPDTWSPDNLRYLSVLLHELVHHMQNKNGQTLDTHRSCELEAPAYDAQKAWLEAAGVEDPYEVMGVGVMTVVMATSCMSDY